MSYQPISCAFYDELEQFATHRKEIVIVYEAGPNEKMIVTGIIENIYIRDNVEYLKLDSGIEIRLDHVISAGGKLLNDYYQVC